MTEGRVLSPDEHVALDLSWSHNEGQPPQCWTCGLSDQPGRVQS